MEVINGSLDKLWISANNAAVDGMSQDSRYANFLCTVGTHIFGGGLAADYLDLNFKALKRDLNSPKKNATNSLNSTDPLVKFPLPKETTCPQIADTISAVEREQISVAGSTASGYKDKLNSYLNQLKTLQSQNNCEEKQKLEDAQTQLQIASAAQQSALSGASQGIKSTSAPISGMSIALIAGGVLLTAVVFIIVSGKATPQPAVA